MCSCGTGATHCYESPGDRERTADSDSACAIYCGRLPIFNTGGSFALRHGPVGQRGNACSIERNAGVAA